MKMIKFPRTPHIEGSRQQPGDEDLDSVPFDEIKGQWIVVGEKLDGANAGLRFDESGELYLQSRGHFLEGGYRERHFDLFKQWASTRAQELHAVLGHRYAVYGEWLFAKHTIFYDQLPHYFLVFDVLDVQEERFLTTPQRRELLDPLPLVSAPVLYEGPATTHDDLLALLTRATFKSPCWRDAVVSACATKGIDEQQAWLETDQSELMEGLYIKVETDHVVERYKWVRASFLTTVVDSGTHWLRRPIVPNELQEGVELFGG